LTLASLSANPAARQPLDMSNWSDYLNLNLMKSIAVIPKSTTQVFWKTVEAGAREGAKEAGVEVVGFEGEPDSHIRRSV
jgi:ABC-type sugar transport system substrate-binding protein